MATAFGDAALAAFPEFPAPGEPATPRERTPCASLRSNSFREHETYARLNPRASRALVAVLGRGLTRRRRLGFIRAAARPCAALQPPPWRSTGGMPGCHCNAVRGRDAARMKPRRPRWTVLRPSAACVRRKAQSGRRVRYLARKSCLSEAQRSEFFCAGRMTVQRGEFGRKPRSGATERRSHRAAARPRAALPPRSMSGEGKLEREIGF